MIIANATGCSSIWGGSAPSTPYTTNKDGHGPAWANSLFEDNAEFGYGMFLGMEQNRDRLADRARTAIEANLGADLNEALQNWLDNKDKGEESKEAAMKLIPVLEKYADQSEEVAEILR